MENVRDSWTDERLDNFASRVDERFDGVERRMDGLEHRMDGLDRRMDMLNHRMDDGLGRIDARIDALTQMMFRLGAGLIATIVIGFLSVLTM